MLKVRSCNIRTRQRPKKSVSDELVWGWGGGGGNGVGGGLMAVSWEEGMWGGGLGV